MKSQEHNKGELKKLEVTIEKDVAESIEKMSEVTGISLDDHVVIALKRYRASHGDYLGKTPQAD